MHLEHMDVDYRYLLLLNVVLKDRNLYLIDLNETYESIDIDEKEIHLPPADVC